STGKVTIRSTSSGAIPCASVMTTTVGAFRSGNTSTSILDATYKPDSVKSSEAIRTANRLFNENAIIRLSIVIYVCNHFLSDLMYVAMGNCFAHAGQFQMVGAFGHNFIAFLDPCNNMHRPPIVATPLNGLLAVHTVPFFGENKE